MSSNARTVKKGPFTLSASHKSQVPDGQVSLTVDVPDNFTGEVEWTVEPDQGGFSQRTGLTNVWTAPGVAGAFTLKAEVKNIARAGGDDGPSAGSGAGDASTPAPIPSPETLELAVDVTPTALPPEVIDRLDAGVDILERRLPGGSVRLERQYPELTPQKALWAIIRNRTDAISFKNYKQFMDSVMCGKPGAPQRFQEVINRLNYRGTDAYDVIKTATEFFLMQETGVNFTELSFNGGEERQRLPQLADDDAAAAERMAQNRDNYLRQLEADSFTFPYFHDIKDRLQEIPLKPSADNPDNCYGILKSRIAPPVLIELIWSYWNEEAALVQSMKAISLRFQNRAVKNARGEGDTLTNLNIDPLRPLSNIIWGYVQDEQNRLSLARRAYEYDHHYGFSISGKAVPKLRPADSRQGFLASFHTLLHRCSILYREQTDTTKVPDGYPLLNALKECHLLLAHGAHNQYGDLPWTSRQEMLVEQWILSRPETRDFLGRSVMVPYAEEWMASVDQMRDLMGWRGGSVRHFHELADFGEKVVLSIRFGNWSDEINEQAATLWAQYWKQEIQAYINAYRVVTGVDLSADADRANEELFRKRMTAPSELIKRRAETASPVK